MKVAISAISGDTKQPVSPVFGRCPGFVIAETEGKQIKEHSFVPNAAAQSAMGAGIAAAQTVASQGVQAVISGNIGPNAFMVLNQSGIKVYQVTGLSIEQAVQQLAEGKLQEVPAASAPGHFGMGAGRGLGSGRGAGRGAGAGRRFGGGRSPPM
jgi:predicted Fe-Mo cluster-binding NifX family protein